MCRMLGYVGPPIDLHALLVAPERGLLDQSWRPRRQQHGTVNADGWGVGWYTDGAAAPARYRSLLPMWSDPHLDTLLPSVHAGIAIAAVRGATPPSPTQITNTPPYASGKLLVAHNGLVDGFHEGVGEELRRTLAVGRATALEGSTDSELLLALIAERVARGAPIPGAIAATVTTVLALAPARLNLLVSDGATLWAARWGDSLWLCDRTSVAGGVTVASEPDGDESGWAEVPERSLVTVSGGGVTIEPLERDEGAA
jgi:glutamine amidotransferase